MLATLCPSGAAYGQWLTTVGVQECTSLLQGGAESELLAEPGWVWDFTRKFHLLSFFSILLPPLSCRFLLQRTSLLNHLHANPCLRYTLEEDVCCLRQLTRPPEFPSSSPSTKDIKTMTQIWLAHSLRSSGPETSFVSIHCVARINGTHDSLQPQSCSLINKAR